VPAVGALEALERPPGVAAPHATAHAPFLCSPSTAGKAHEAAAVQLYA